MSATPRLRFWRVKTTGRPVGAPPTRHPPFYVLAADLPGATAQAYALLTSISATTRWDLTVTAHREGIIR